MKFVCCTRTFISCSRQKGYRFLPVTGQFEHPIRYSGPFDRQTQAHWPRGTAVSHIPYQGGESALRIWFVGGSVWPDGQLQGYGMNVACAKPLSECSRERSIKSLGYGVVCEFTACSTSEDGKSRSSDRLVNSRFKTIFHNSWKLINQQKVQISLTGRLWKNLLLIPWERGQRLDAGSYRELLNEARRLGNNASKWILRLDRWSRWTIIRDRRGAWTWLDLLGSSGLAFSQRLRFRHHLFRVR